MGFRSFMQSLSAGINAGVVGFREASITTNAEQDTIEFSDWNNRRARYALFWALYENSIYRNLHSFSRPYKANYGLYQYIRSIYPCTAPRHVLSDTLDGRQYRSACGGWQQDS
jgi:hypothetical protein